MSRFAGRHALVTGAGSGIGREVALGLSREGAASVTLVDVDQTALEDLSGTCGGRLQGRQHRRRRR